MIHIRKVKTLSGMKYAVVAPFTSTVKNEDGTMSQRTEMLVADYRSGKEVRPAMFPYTSEGLRRAKEVQKILKN